MSERASEPLGTATDTRAQVLGTTAGLQGVLIDMDGTLLDSEKVWEVALHDLAASFGGRLSPAARALMVGSSMARSTAIMSAELGVELDPVTTRRFLHERMAELFAAELAWKPGAERLLLAVREAGIPTALVTATQRKLTEDALNFMGRHLFDASVCGDEVTRGKPDPEPYQRAAALLGADPARCVAIEDSPTGIQSAEGAGCAVLAVPSEIPIAPATSRVLRESLIDVDVDQLQQLIAERLSRP